MKLKEKKQILLYYVNKHGEYRDKVLADKIKKVFGLFGAEKASDRLDELALQVFIVVNKNNYDNYVKGVSIITKNIDGIFQKSKDLGMKKLSHEAIKVNERLKEVKNISSLVGKLNNENLLQAVVNAKEEFNELEPIRERILKDYNKILVEIETKATPIKAEIIEVIKKNKQLVNHSNLMIKAFKIFFPPNNKITSAYLNFNNIVLEYNEDFKTGDVEEFIYRSDLKSLKILSEPIDEIGKKIKEQLKDVSSINKSAVEAAFISEIKGQIDLRIKYFRTKYGLSKGVNEENLDRLAISDSNTLINALRGFSGVEDMQFIVDTYKLIKSKSSDDSDEHKVIDDILEYIENYSDVPKFEPNFELAKDVLIVFKGEGIYIGYNTNNKNGYVFNLAEEEVETIEELDEKEIKKQEKQAK